MFSGNFRISCVIVRIFCRAICLSNFLIHPLSEKYCFRYVACIPLYILHPLSNYSLIIPFQTLKKYNCNPIRRLHQVSKFFKYYSSCTCFIPISSTKGTTPQSLEISKILLFVYPFHPYLCHKNFQGTQEYLFTSVFSWKDCTTLNTQISQVLLLFVYLFHPYLFQKRTSLLLFEN